MKWQRLLSLVVLILFIAVFYVNDASKKIDISEYNSKRFKVKENVSLNYSLNKEKNRDSTSQRVKSAIEVESEDINELLGLDSIVKSSDDIEQYYDTGEALDPDNELLDEDVVHYQDTGKFMDPDSEQLENEALQYQDTGELLDADNVTQAETLLEGENEYQNTGTLLNPDEDI